MKIRNLVSGQEFEAEVSMDHAAASYGQAVVTVDGEAIDPVGVEIIEISDDEQTQLPPWWQAVIA